MSEAAEAPVVEVEAEQPAAVVEEQNTETAEQADPPPADEPKPEDEAQRRSKFQRRIDRKNEEIAQARTEAETLRRRLEALEQQRSPAPSNDAPPRLDQFDSWDEYQQANVAYAAKIARQELRREIESEREAERQKQAREAEHATVQTWNDRKAAAAEKYADFEEVLGDSDAPMTIDMRQAIIESDMGADIAYWLAKNPTRAKEIAGMSPVRQIAAIGRVEAELSVPKPKVTTQAPPPITPAGSKAKAERDPSQMTDAEFAAWRKRQIAQRR